MRPGLIIKPEHPQTVLTGANVSFTCETQTGKIEWYKKITKFNAHGQEVTVSDTKIQRIGSKIVDAQLVGYKTSILTVTNAKTIDAGIYECALKDHKYGRGYVLKKNTRLYVYGKFI